MNRRELLVALGACAFAGPACLRRPPVLALPDGPFTLGWRWVPGETLAYTCVMRRETDQRVASRAEAWAWLVRDVDRDGVATLEGRLTGFGAGLVVGGEPASDDDLATALAVEQARADQVVSLRMGIDGSLVDLDPLGFAEALPHRLLALRLPSTPVAPHDEWPMPGLVRPFAGLVPTGLDTETQATGRLAELGGEGEHVIATIETTGSVRAPGGPAIQITGTARWDTVRGALDRRDLVARFTPSSPDPASNPGTLSVTLWRVQG